MFPFTDFEKLRPPDLVKVEDFQCAPKGLVKKVTEWSAKAAAAFHGSMDVLETISGSEQYRFAPGRVVRNKMLVPLMDLHAFDKGDAQQMRVLEDVRGKLIDSMRDLYDPFSRMYSNSRAPKYWEFDSKESLFGQAADIAAGIAAVYFQRDGIAGLVIRFEHVTYNGKRVSQADIADIMHKQKGE